MITITYLLSKKGAIVAFGMKINENFLGSIPYRSFIKIDKTLVDN